MPEPENNKGAGALYFLILLASLSAGVGWLAWKVAHGHYYQSGDDVGYNMGLIGGLMMLALLTYPIRKHFRFALRWGDIRYWFSLHMMFGIFGPLLVLFHSTFRINSINAGVALFSMMLVASSGAIGRYAYRHIHRGLYGSKLTLNDLEEELLGSRSDTESKLKNYPKVLLVLHDFHCYALQTQPGFLGRIVKFLTLPIRRRYANLRCAIYMPRYSRQSRQRRELVLDYLYAVERVAQFDAFERIFSLWHVLHIPLVYLLVASAVWHVVAVHMY